MKNWEALVEKYDFLNNIESDTKEKLKSALVVREYQAGETLMYEGVSCVGFSLIVSGGIRVYKTSENARELTLYKLVPGDTCYLSMSCILGDNDYEVYAEVLEDTKIAFVPREMFNKYIYNTMEFQQYMVDNLYKKYLGVLGVLEEVIFERVDVRLAKYLKTSSEELNNSHYLYLTQEKIAGDIGTSREVVSRILTEFKNKGILKSSRGKITIMDLEKLATASKK